jgi:hypothetical protein
LGLQAKFGGFSFLPTSDFGTIAIDVRSPASSSLEYSRLKLEQAAAWRFHDQGNQADQQLRQRYRRPHLRRHRQAKTERKRSSPRSPSRTA